MFTNFSYLYVEDDPLSREIMQMLMGTVLGVNTLTMFEDSQDFTGRLSTLPQPPQVIMLDIHVQPHDGFDMLRMIRQNPIYQDSKIIALTASVMNEEVERLRGSGFDGAIGKPLSVQTFPELLNRILSGDHVWHVV